ncbi:hypothetical protein [Aeromonas allosaccharophila]|nr:hypothetical protein [Aeromonas allosaccharophila]
MSEAMTEAELYAPVQHAEIAQRCAQLFAQLRSTRSEGKNHD